MLATVRYERQVDIYYNKLVRRKREKTKIEGKEKKREGGPACVSSCILGDYPWPDQGLPALKGLSVPTKPNLSKLSFSTCQPVLFLPIPVKVPFFPYYFVPFRLPTGFQINFYKFC